MTRGLRPRGAGRGAPGGAVLACRRRQAAPRPGARATGCCRCPTIDPIVVARSGAALPAYGPKFRYSHYAGTKTLRFAAGGAAAVTRARSRRAGEAGAQPPAVPDQARRRPRSEPPREVVVPRRLRRRGRRPAPSAPASPAATPGYDETAKMLAESALCLALDDNPPTSGQVTTAQAMGDNLARPPAEGRDRVRGRGLRLWAYPKLGIRPAKPRRGSAGTHECGPGQPTTWALARECVVMGCPRPRGGTMYSSLRACWACCCRARDRHRRLPRAGRPGVRCQPARQQRHRQDRRRPVRRRPGQRAARRL